MLETPLSRMATVMLMVLLRSVFRMVGEHQIPYATLSFVDRAKILSLVMIITSLEGREYRPVLSQNQLDSIEGSWFQE